MKATVTYSDGSTADVTSSATWTSAQAAIATVNASGLVTGVAAGSAQISANVGAVTGTASITVPAASITVTSIAVAPTGVTLAVGGTQQLTATATYSDGSTSDASASASWSSSSAGVAAVNASGLASGIAPGSATLTATVSGVSGSTSVTVSAPAPVKTLTSVTLSPSSATPSVGQTQQFTATAAYSDGSTTDVSATASWKSSNSALLTVSTTGLATAVAAGTVEVTASFGGKSGMAAVTVSATSKTVSTLALSPTKVSVSVGGTQQLTATATYTDGSTATVVATAWASSNPGVATVSSSGLITAVADGTATMTATLNGKTATAAVTVAAKTVTSLAVSPNPITVSMQGTQQLTATATYADHSTGDVSKSVSWSVSDANVATVSATGLLTASAAGTTTITAKLNGISATDGLTVQIAAGTGVNIPTWQQGATREGLNDGEQSLKPANVNAASFGKLFSYTTDGYAYAEPLLMSNIQVNGSAHNVLYVATENDSVYAFDADTYGTGKPLWQTSLLKSGETPLSKAAIAPVLGVTSTPVIDPSTNTIYVVSAQSSSGSSTFRLNALDITTGAQRTGSPVTIQASVPGTNSDATNGIVSLTNSCIQRAALLLANGNIYMGFGSCHSGWLLAYNAQTLAQVGVFNASPNLDGEGPYASAGGIWMGGGGPTVDGNGNVYVVTGNGPWDGQTAFGDTVLEFTPDLQKMTDLFTPDDYAYLNCKDTDLAAGGVTLLPGGSQLMVGGKSGWLYLVNLNAGSLGGEQPGDAGVGQKINFDDGLLHAYSATCTDTSGAHMDEVNSYEIFGTAASFNGSVYLGVTPTGANVPAGVRRFSYSGGKLTPQAETATNIQEGSYGTTPFISANGTSDGVLWMVDHGNPLQTASPTAATLRAYDAGDLGTELYNSSTNSADTPGFGIKFTSPIVGNGKVYISTGLDPVGNGARGEIDVYGLK